jgi:hypothetical protein
MTRRSTIARRSSVALLAALSLPLLLLVPGAGPAQRAGAVVIQPFDWQQQARDSVAQRQLAATERIARTLEAGQWDQAWRQNNYAAVTRTNTGFLELMQLTLANFDAIGASLRRAHEDFTTLRLAVQELQQQQAAGGIDSTIQRSQRLADLLVVAQKAVQASEQAAKEIEGRGRDADRVFARLSDWNKERSDMLNRLALLEARVKALESRK